MRQLHAWLCFLGLFPLILQAQMVNVGLNPADRIQSVNIKVLGDEMIITTGDSFPQFISVVNTNEYIDIKAEKDYLRLKKGEEDIGKYNDLLLWTNDEKPEFRMELNASSGKITRNYAGQLYIAPGTRNLLLINKIQLDDYIRGVVHAEAGHHRSLDFFKVQALSARTYAMNNLGRHSAQGFDLCDNTHCQAYKGLSNDISPLVDQAIKETMGEVIVYADSELIDAVFSANCGGYTANSEDVWISSVSYLRSVPDYNFCEGSYNHAWHLTIPKIEFLARIGQYMKEDAVSFEIIPDVSGRVRQIILNGNPAKAISGEELRRIFKFKSSMFHVYDSRSLLFIEGSGFGHGVGMCQDGAYYMSKEGMDYVRIIQHYYQGVTIRQINEVKSIWQ